MTRRRNVCDRINDLEHLGGLQATYAVAQWTASIVDFLLVISELSR